MHRVACYHRGMMYLLSVKQIAARTGEPYDTIRSLAGRRLRGADNGFPDPDVAIGDEGRARTYGWTADAIDSWHEVYVANRPHSRAAK
ncbi:helix-turn-helix DNA binding domain protein [Gordonia phage Malisha]|nr:helix-turn-helix DNA binding domain protein [Gordonia phage Malisha]